MVRNGFLFPFQPENKGRGGEALLFKGSDLADSAGQGFTTARLTIPGTVCALPTFTPPSHERGARIAFHLDCYCSVVHKHWVRACVKCCLIQKLLKSLYPSSSIM